ncbi:MAG: PHB depolymerase family esterase [Flavobacteriaceae bacterium]
MKTIKRIAFLLTLGLVTALSIGCSNDAETKEEETTYTAGLIAYDLNWEDRDRTYQVYFPTENHAEKSLPLLFVLHGGGGDAAGFMDATFNRFNELADIHGFIVVYPEGFEKQWNDGRDVAGLATAWDEKINDVGFITEIIRILSSDYTIDSSRIFTTGISNGGFMSSRLLCDRADLFRGGAIVTATLVESHLGSCNPGNEVAVLVLNGTEDPLVPYDGGQITILGQERGLVLSTDAYMNFWATNNGCNTTPAIEDLPDMHDDDTTVQIYSYPSCNSQSPVTLYRIDGGGHTWPGAQQNIAEIFVGKTSQELVACDVIWEFFSEL